MTAKRNTSGYELRHQSGPSGLRILGIPPLPRPPLTSSTFGLTQRSRMFREHKRAVAQVNLLG